MKLFECQSCGQLLYFENATCLRCGHRLGFLPDRILLSALREQAGVWYPLAAPAEAWRSCANAGEGGCNWLVPAAGGDAFCRACRLNRTIPDLGADDNKARWQRMEQAKRRLVYGLIRLGLPIVGRDTDPAGLAFDLLADPEPQYRESEGVMTGHKEGLITINIAEADDAWREQHRQQMAEPYRTLIGHFRHEVGHHYWEKLVRDGARLDAFRAMFGDERQDYGAALEAHYGGGGRADAWQDAHVSAYASAHPWEDWAETWAHYMHIVDTLETAHAHGFSVDPQAGRSPDLAVSVDFDPYVEPNLDALLRAWLPLAYAVNSLNRSMGQPDLYPFVLVPAVADKLRFVHDVVWECRAHPD